MKIKDAFNFKRQLNKPEYFFNPRLIIKRLKSLATQKTHKKSANQLEVKIDQSGSPFYVNAGDVIGDSIVNLGVYDLVVAETLKRILKQGDVFFDVGANIGFFSRKALEYGATVESFEPHPILFNVLAENLEAFSKCVKLNNFALSHSSGYFELYVPNDFENNQGIASLEPQKNSSSFKVETQTLDQITQSNIKLLKIDVEGHEHSVLLGAQELLKQKRVEYIIFEDFDAENSRVVELLKSYGYKTKRLKKTFWGPRIVNINESKNIPLWEPPNFIASYSYEKIDELFVDKKWNYYQS